MLHISSPAAAEAPLTDRQIGKEHLTPWTLVHKPGSLHLLIEHCQAAQEADDAEAFGQIQSKC